VRRIACGVVLALAAGCSRTVTTLPVETRVVVYRAAPPAGSEYTGSCFTRSVAVIRADAWRCSIDGNVKGANLFDPCFTIADEKNAVVCGADPVKETPGFKVKLTAPLPAEKFKPSADAERPWMIQFNDEVVCAFMTGATFGINDKRANYGCSDGDWILGDPTPGTIWRAEKSTVSTEGGQFSVVKSETAPIRTVWR
jgi:hypothetical protein